MLDYTTYRIVTPDGLQLCVRGACWALHLSADGGTITNAETGREPSMAELHDLAEMERPGLERLSILPPAPAGRSIVAALCTAFRDTIAPAALVGFAAALFGAAASLLTY